MPIAGVLAAIFAFVLAKPIIHLRGDYLLIVTIGIVEIVRIALTNNLFGLTGGANGIYGIARAFPVRDGVLIAQAPVLPHLDLHHPDHVPVLRAGAFPLRQGAQLHPLRRSRGIGLRHRRDPGTSSWPSPWARSGAGMVGTLFAANIRTIEPTSFNFYESVILFAIVILGGSGSIAGVVLGAFLLIGLQDVFREFESARMLIFGAAMMVMMIICPQGLLPPRRRFYNARFLVGRFPRGVQRAEPAREEAL